MKILHLNEHLGWSGGIETYLLSLIPLLEQAGHQSVVAFARGDRSLVKQSHEIPQLEGASRRAIREGGEQVAQLIKDQQPDLVHVHNIHNVGAIAAAMDAAPTIVTAHDYRYICPTSSLFYRRSQTVCDRVCGPGCFTTTLLHKCMTPRPVYAARYYHRVRWAMANAHRFRWTIAPSRYVADRFIRAGFPTDRTMVLPYFCPIPVAAAPARHDHQPTMLFIGRVRETKGVECFVRALGLMASDVRGLIVGDASPKQLADLRAIATASNCAQRLEIRPWASRDQLREIYAQATIFAFPSIWPETLGIVGLEALASGVPVVASHIGGVREWLIDGQTGLLVPPNDPKSLADAASRLIAAPQLREAMGRNGTALIRSRFSPAAHVVNLIDLYERAQAAGPATLVAA